GYQLLGFPASPGAPGSPCVGLPQAPCLAASIIQTGAYNTAVPAVSMAGTCFTTGACGIGEGGMERNSKLPYASNDSLEMHHQFGGGFETNPNSFFVSAHSLVRGNNINFPCPAGTTKSGPPTDPLPEWMPGILNANGTLSPCSGTPTLATGALAG